MHNSHKAYDYRTFVFGNSIPISLSRVLPCSLAPLSGLLRIRSIFILPLRTRSNTPWLSLNLSTDVGTILKHKEKRILLSLITVHMYISDLYVCACSYQWLDVCEWFPMVVLRSGGLTSSICANDWWAGEEKELCGEAGGCSSERGPPGDSAVWHREAVRTGVPIVPPEEPNGSGSRVPCFLFRYSSKDTYVVKISKYNIYQVLEITSTSASEGCMSHTHAR